MSCRDDDYSYYCYSPHTLHLQDFTPGTVPGPCLQSLSGPQKLFFNSLLFYRPRHASCRILVPQTEIEPAPPALEVQSPSHWTAREVPAENIFDHLPVVHGMALQAAGKPNFLQSGDCVFQALKDREVRTETWRDREREVKRDTERQRRGETQRDVERDEARR